MQIDTRSVPFGVSNPSGNATNTSITFPVPSVTAPTGAGLAAGDGIIPAGHGGGAMCANGLMLVPYGAGAAANTFLMNAYGWRPVHGGSVGTAVADLWVAYELATFTCTLCTVPGLANTPVNASQLFVGTIALGVGNANISNEIISPTGNVVAHIILDIKGSRFVELRFSTNGSATSMNCLWATL